MIFYSISPELHDRLFLEPVPSRPASAFSLRQRAARSDSGLLGGANGGSEAVSQ